MKISFCSKEKIKSWAVWPTYIYGQGITISQAILLLLQKHSYTHEMWSNYFFIFISGMVPIFFFFFNFWGNFWWIRSVRTVPILLSRCKKSSFPQGNDTPLKVYLKSMPSNLSQLRGWVEGRLLKHTLARTNLRPRCSRSHLDLSRFSIFTDLVIKALTVDLWKW